MKELTEIRAELDVVDRQLVALFEQRMLLARQVAAYKQMKGMPVLDRSREEAVLDARAALLEDRHFEPALRDLFEKIMALSRQEQEFCLKEANHHA